MCNDDHVDALIHQHDVLNPFAVLELQTIDLTLIMNGIIARQINRMKKPCPSALRRACTRSGILSPDHVSRSKDHESHGPRHRRAAPSVN